MKKYMRLMIVLLFFIGFHQQNKACTVAVISGKYTQDGRPLLWKNRDTDAINNKMMYFEKNGFKYIGLVNSGDKDGKSIWIGMNNYGFAIMNSASYNLNIGDTNEQSGYEGKLMRLALENCKTIQDFEKMLDTIARPTLLEANFGVIDGQNGAALYELGNKGYVKFDANDPSQAPFGYVIRANYSFTGSFGTESSGYIRYNTTQDLFYQAVSTNSMNAQFICQDVTRGLNHSLLKTNLIEQYASKSKNSHSYAFFHDYVPRKSSASACVVQGVKKDEDPNMATMWNIVGFPLTSVAVPMWVDGKDKFPSVLKYNEEIKDSPVCKAALTLKGQLFDIRWGKFANGYYINITDLVNSENSGILQKISPYEDQIFIQTNQLIEDWRKNGKNEKAMISFYDKLDADIKALYLKEFNLTL